MSKPHVSPYRRNIYNNNQPSRSPYREQQHSRLAEKSKLSHSYIADNQTAQKSRINHTPQHIYRQTQKKYNNNYQNNNRLDTLLQQNKYLLSENNQLSNIINQRSRTIIALQRKLQEHIAQEVQTLEQIQLEKNRFLDQYSIKIREQNRQNQRLMDQIAQLNQDLYQLELAKSRSNQVIKETLTKQHRKQLQHILTTHSQSIELLNLENSKNKSEIADRNQKICELQNQVKILKQNMNFNENQFNKKIAHTNHIHNLELSEQKLGYEAKIKSIQKDLQQANQINSHQLESQISALKKQINSKNNQVQLLNTQLMVTDVDKQNHMQDLQTRIAELQAQIISGQQQHRQKLSLQRNNWQKSSQTQLQSNQQCYSQMINNLKTQNKRLMAIIDAKNQQIQRLNQTLQQQRSRRQADKRENQLRQKILKQAQQQDQQARQQQEEGLKIKLAHLRKADLDAIKSYYQNQMGVMEQQLKQKQDIINMNRQKVHHQLQQKNQMRKQFEIEISKLNSKIAQLELRISGLILQRKQQISNIQSRIQVTSMTLVRQSTQKQKYAQYSHGQKKQLQNIIKSKDTQIQQLFDKIHMMSQNHKKQITKKNQQIKVFQQTINSIEQQLKKQKLFYENQLIKKANIHQNDKMFYESEIGRIKKQMSDDYTELNDNLTQEKSILEANLQKLARQNQQLRQKIQNMLQVNQQMGLDNQVALHQTKTDLMNTKSIVQVSLKKYYDNQLDTKVKQIQQLKVQIKQLNADIRLGKQRQAKLQDKVSKLVRGQQKLRQMQQKVLAMGQQNNIVKNLSQIVKRKQRK